MNDTFEGAGAASGYVVDMGNVDMATNELIPKGKYPAIIEKCEFTLSQSSGQPMWTLVVAIQGGDFDGRKLFTHMSFSPKALPMTKRHLAILAPDLASRAFDPSEEEDVLVGKECTVKVKHEVYDGEKRAKVGDFLPSGDAGGSSAGAFFGA